MKEKLTNDLLLMKKQLTNNLLLKLISLVLAFGVFFIVTNVINPEIRDTKEITVEVINKDALKDKGLTYELDGKNTVQVSYLVRSRDRYKVHVSDFRATADLEELYLEGKKVESGMVQIRLELVGKDTKSLVHGTPTLSQMGLKVKLDKLQTKTFDIEVKGSYKVADGYAIGEQTVNPKRVSVTGGEKEIGRIHSVGVDINTAGADSSLEGVTKVNLYDANDKILSLDNKVEMNLNQVSYRIEVLKVKRLNLDFQVGGVVAEGYRYTGLEEDIRETSVEGMKSALASLNSLVIPAEILNLEGAKNDITVHVDLKKLLPDNITIAPDAPSQVKVVLKVEKLQEREIYVDPELVTLTGKKEGFLYSVDDFDSEIVVRGLAEELNSIDEEKLHFTADVADLESGTHVVTVSVDLNDFYEIVSEGTVVVRIRGIDEPEPEEEDDGPGLE